MSLQDVDDLGNAVGEAARILEMTFVSAHRPLQAYTEALADAGVGRCRGSEGTLLQPFRSPHGTPVADRVPGK